MSKYDGLIIPRSYSDYINKTDSATLTQAVNNSGVLNPIKNVIPDDAASDNKLISTTQLNGSLAEYAKTTDLASYAKKSDLDVVEYVTVTCTKNGQGESNRIGVYQLKAGHTYIIDVFFELKTSENDTFNGYLYLNSIYSLIRFNGSSGGGSHLVKIVSVQSNTDLYCSFYNSTFNNVSCDCSLSILKLK